MSKQRKGLIFVDKVLIRCVRLKLKLTKQKFNSILTIYVSNISTKKEKTKKISWV